LIDDCAVVAEGKRIDQELDRIATARPPELGPHLG
jgi:hypothetical protein